MHIPPDRLLPQDLVNVLDHGPADVPFEKPVVVRMHSTDAKHAMDVEPARWSLDPIKPPEAEAEAIADDENEDTF